MDNSFEFITGTDRAEKVLAELFWDPLIALDTETYWNPDYGRASVSLIQIAAPNREVIVIDADAIDIKAVSPVVESSAVMVAAHNARFDIGMLAGEGLRPAGFVDTLRLARIALRLPSYSLAALVDFFFGIKLDKSYQRSNWRRRPLSLPQLKYAAMDAHVTLMLFQHLEEMLREEGRLELGMRAALMDNARPSTRSRRKVIAVPERDLSETEQRILLTLKKWRLERSFKRRIPAYQVCADRTLNELAMERPQKLEDLEAIYGMGPARIADIGFELIELLRLPSEVIDLDIEVDEIQIIDPTTEP